MLSFCVWYDRQGDARKIAVSGYLQMLRQFQVYGSLPASQMSQSYMSASSQVQFLNNNNNSNRIYDAPFSKGYKVPGIFCKVGGTKFEL